MRQERTDKLVGFVWCYGSKDFGCLEIDSLSDEDQNAIEQVLLKYGTPERNVYNRKFSDIFSENYGVVRKKKVKDLTAKERAAYLYAQSFFDAYCPYEGEEDREYCAYNFKEMYKTDFMHDNDNEDLKEWLKTIISMWPDDLYVISEESEEDE